MSDTTAQQPTEGFSAEPTTFVGRATELARLGDALTTSRLVTVTGPGGVGKTRLARRAAADSEAAFGDGVHLIELSALRDPELLANTVSASLGLSEHDARGALEQVLDYLRERRVLLILDTCEHLVEACALFAEAVLARTASVTILATSRQPLLVDGEHDYQLAPLGAGGDAVNLFAQRAAAAAPGFEITESNRADVTRLCAHLDGVPLAIELAAGRLRDLSLDELAKRLDEHFLDAPGAQDAPVDRHRTLRDAIGWSYALCTPEEQTLWERLSVFAGPVAADAAQQVCAGEGLDREAAMSRVFGLIDKSVLTRAEGSGGVSRYGMLDTIREYGAERLGASGTGEQVRVRHLRRYLALAEDLAARTTEHQVAKIGTLRAEHADLRAALEYAATVDTEGPGHPAVKLPADLEWYWVISGRTQEARYWLDRALERVPDPGPDRASALITRGFMALFQGEIPATLADSEEAIALADSLGDRLLKARALAVHCYGLSTAARFDEAQKFATEVKALSGPDDWKGPLLYFVLVEGYVCLLAGDPEAALRHSERILRSMPGDNDERWLTGYMHIVGGLAMSMLGQPDEGNKSVLRGLAMKREIYDLYGMVNTIGIAGMVAAAQQRPERTAWIMAANDVLWEQWGPAYAGVDAMQGFMNQAIHAARGALGDGRYDEVARDARSRPLDEIIDMVIRDLDTMPALPPAGPRP